MKWQHGLRREIKQGSWADARTAGAEAGADVGEHTAACDTHRSHCSTSSTCQTNQS